MDNGWPWGSGGDLPPPLALWLWGLGCGVIWNPPRRPQKNGKVERFHGLLDPWGEPGQCADWAAWEARVTWVVQLQREVYPAVAGQSRLAACPALRQNPRRFGPETEAVWSVAAVHAQLARGQWRRVVGKKGQITVYNRAVSVGTSHARDTVWVRFDADTRQWVATARAGQEVKRWAAPELTAARILALDVSYVKPHRQRAAPDPNLVAHVVT